MKRIIALLALCLLPAMASLCLAESGAVDLDFTQMDSDAVSEALYDMMDAPEDHQGKRARLLGHVSYIEDDRGDPDVFYLILGDYTSCCAQSIEFVPEDTAVDLDGIAFTDTEVSVTGTLEFYDDEGYTDVRLTDAQLSRTEN